MTRPKKWYLDVAEAADWIILNYASAGPVKKPNASSPVGPIQKVSVPSGDARGRLTEDEALLVSREVACTLQNSDIAS